MINYNSFYKKRANETLYWLPMDTELLYTENLKNRYAELEKHGWINRQFTYKFNSLGFRCDEFTEDPSIMFLGCSLVCGVGLPKESIWPEIVSSQLNMKCANLGIGGSSCDTAFRLCHGYLKRIKPKIVIFMVPPGIRSELVTSGAVVNKMAGKDDIDYVHYWASDENNNYFNREKNMLGIQMLCHMENVKLLIVDSNELKKCSDSLARDLLHYGEESNRIFSDRVLSKL